MKCFFTIVFTLLSFNLIYAQRAPTIGANCKISGRIVDSSTRQPVAYAAVTAYPAGSKTLAGGMITDEKGQFTVEQLVPGEYQLKIEYAGYRPMVKSGITLSSDHPSARLGDIAIGNTDNKMADVTITGSRNFMEDKLDKFVYNVDKDISSQTGVATDILRKVPQVSVDVDGNIELLGSANIRVFINGKPSAMFDNNLTEALQAIPASEIKSIEIITSPGAQYDAQGTGGIINIILKTDKSQGVNGSTNLTAGTRLENGAVNLHAHKNKFDVNVGIGGSGQLNGTTLNTMDRHTSGDTSELKENGTGAESRSSYRGQIGVEWNVTPKSTVNAFVKYNNFGSNLTGATGQQQLTNEPLNALSDTSSTRYSTSNFRYRFLDYNISYINKIDSEGQELDITFQSSYCRYNSFYQQYERYTDSTTSFQGGEGNDRLHDFETYCAADYSLPVAKGIELNTGAKGTFTREYSYSDRYLLNTSNDNYDFDPSGLNNFNFLRDVYAAYVSLTFPVFEKTRLKLGIRDEYTNITLPIDTTDPSYNSFIPSITLSHKLSKEQTIKISYTKRIQRADYKISNPYIDATDPSSLLQGNPYLRPERSDVAELSYSRFFKGGNSVLATLYYRNTHDDEQSYILHEDSVTLGNTIYRNVTITTNENAGDQQITGVNLSGSYSPVQPLEIHGSANIFDKYIVSNLVPGTTINSVNYRINANVTYKFNETLTAEFFGNFNSQRTEIQGKFPSFTTYSLAVRKVLFHKKGSIAFTTTNPFNRYVDQATEVAGTDFSVVSDRKIPYQSFGINFTYKFGRMEYKEKKDEHNEDEEAGTHN